MPKETWTLWCRRDTEARMTRLTSSVWLSIWRSFWSVDYNQMSYIILDIVYCKIVFKIRNKRRKIARPQKIKFKKNTHLPQKKKKLKFIFFSWSVVELNRVQSSTQRSPIGIPLMSTRVEVATPLLLPQYPSLVASSPTRTHFLQTSRLFTTQWQTTNVQLTKPTLITIR